MAHHVLLRGGWCSQPRWQRAVDCGSSGRLTCLASELFVCLFVTVQAGLPGVDMNDPAVLAALAAAGDEEEEEVRSLPTAFRPPPFAHRQSSSCRFGFVRRSPDLMLSSCKIDSTLRFHESGSFAALSFVRWRTSASCIDECQVHRRVPGA
jgi:hypothetical protein